MFAVSITSGCVTDRLSSSVLQVLHTNSPKNSSVNINDILPDSLILEILCRLPCQSALRAKSVCKHWFCLISDPYFLTSFNHYHDQHCRVSHSSLPSTLVYEFSYWHHHLTEKLHRKVHTISQNPVLQTRGFHLDFLPCFRSWESEPIWVVASNKDLLLCYDPKRFYQAVYYVCNPLTKQWLALPPAPSSHRMADTAIGFITSRCSYKLVRVPELDSRPGSNNQFEVEVFCSEVGVWSKFMISSSSRSFTRTWQFKPDAVTFKNKFHWLVNGKTIVVFDPYHSCKGFRVIDLPFELNSDMAICLGSCHEHLKVSQIAGGCLSRVLVVWKLQDYDTGEWNLEYKVGLKKMVLVNHQCFQNFRYLTTEVLAFHPSDEEILYLRFDNRIVMCNVARRTLEVVSECLGESTFSIGTRGVFMLVHPCWPSSIPPLPSI